MRTENVNCGAERREDIRRMKTVVKVAPVSVLLARADGGVGPEPSGIGR